MVKVSIRELLEYENSSHENLIEEMRENGQVNVHKDDLDGFIKAAMNLGVSFRVDSMLDNKIRIYAA